MKETPGMDQKNKRVKQAKVLRVFRKIHRVTGALLFVFFFIVAITGLLLGWKKHSAGLILADTQSGTSSDLKTWLPMDSLQSLAVQFLHQNVSPSLSDEIDRIDVRPGKGVVKFSFKNHYWGLQLDGSTGKLLQVEQRRSDFIEHIHDGSIIDNLLNTSAGLFKLFYTTVMGLALILFTVTGFWLWYGPKRMRKHY